RAARARRPGARRARRRRPRTTTSTGRRCRPSPAPGYSAEPPHRNRDLGAGLDAERARVRPRRHRLRELGPDEVEPDPVLRGEPGRQLARLDEAAIRRPALRLAVVVRAVAAREEAEAAQRRELVAEGVGHARFEPADRAGAGSGEDDPALPRLPQDRVDAVHAPDTQHARAWRAP